MSASPTLQAHDAFCPSEDLAGLVQADQDGGTGSLAVVVDLERYARDLGRQWPDRRAPRACDRERWARLADGLLDEARAAREEAVRLERLVEQSASLHERGSRSFRATRGEAWSGSYEAIDGARHRALVAVEAGGEALSAALEARQALWEQGGAKEELVRGAREATEAFQHAAAALLEAQSLYQHIRRVNWDQQAFWRDDSVRIVGRI